MYFTYILRNSKNILYKGITDNLDRRISQHNNNESKGTKGRGPWVLLYREEYSSRTEARNREKYFKSGAGRELLKQMLNQLLVVK